MSQVHSEIRKAVQVIEAARYRMGVAEFVYTFIDHWAYQQTGLYPPSSKMPKELEPVAVGMAVTCHPPHRSGRALLTHPAPTSSHTVKSLIRVWMHYSWGRDPQCQIMTESLPRHPFALASPFQGL